MCRFWRDGMLTKARGNILYAKEKTTAKSFVAQRKPDGAAAPIPS